MRRRLGVLIDLRLTFKRWNSLGARTWAYCFYRKWNLLGWLFWFWWVRKLVLSSGILSYDRRLGVKVADRN